MAKRKTLFKIRWREQGGAYYDSEIKAYNVQEALELLRKTALLAYGIGYHYVWVFRITNTDTCESIVHIKRIGELLGLETE